VIEIDVKQLLFPGEYLYAHSIHGEVKRTIFPIGEERFWVVEAFPHLVVGSIYEVRPHGLYTSDGKALEVSTSAPPTNYKASAFMIAIPSSFRDAESFIIVDEEDEEGRVKVELFPSVVRQGDEDFIVIGMKTNDGMEIEQWWRQGIGMVRQLFISPPLGEMELLTRELLE
jgi:hypothetical protein